MIHATAKRFWKNNHECSLGAIVLHYYIMALIIFLSCVHNKKKNRNKQRGRDIRHVLAISPPQPATQSRTSELQVHSTDPIWDAPWKRHCVFSMTLTLHLDHSFYICLPFFISLKLNFTDLKTHRYPSAAAAAAAKSLQSCPTLCDPIGGSPWGSVPGILQARTLEWVAISFSFYILSNVSRRFHTTMSWQSPGWQW